MAANRRKPEDQAIGRCTLCSELVTAGSGIMLTGTNIEHRTFWHPNCAQLAATELAALSRRAMTRGASRTPAPLPAWTTDEA